MTGCAGTGASWFAWPALIVIGTSVLGYLAYRLTSTQTLSGESRAHAILAGRYARGEIDDHEYRRRRDELP